MWSLKPMKKVKMLTKTFKIRQAVNFNAMRCMSSLIQRQIALEKTNIPDKLKTSDVLTTRHLGVNEVEQQQMLSAIGCKSIKEMLEKAVPSSILETKLSDMFKHKSADIEQIRSEFLYLQNLKQIASKNKIMTCYQGQGFHPCLTPHVILRNVLENPNWYTPYTPYQAEISQGRLESLLNFQTMITDLTGMDISNASLLCEATAAAEAMYMCFTHFNKKKSKFFVSESTFKHVIEVIKTRAEYLNIEVVVGNPNQIDFSNKEDYCGVLVQNPDINGNITDWQNKAEEVHKAGSLFIIGADILSLPITKSPGEMGADICYGLAQRFGVPMGYGGPHAAFFAVKHDYRYKLPGRVIGVSQDAYGGRALRMAMQTREQHIRRDRATSNICTAQALLANMAAFYGVWHGPKGLTNIAERVNHQAHILHDSLTEIGYKLNTEKGRMFDTISIDVSGESKNVAQILNIFEKEGINLGAINEKTISVSINETTTLAELEQLIQIFGGIKSKKISVKFEDTKYNGLDDTLKRQSSFMEHEIFNSINSETDMMRYIQKLADKDVGLTKSMIPLGSCTMKLNAAVEMIPVSWPEFANIHPFAPNHQAEGYLQMIKELSESLLAATGFEAISMQPNSGASGEYAGLLTIRNFHKANGEHHRDVCLIPQSAHGTNPATANMLGMKIVVIKTDEYGNCDVVDLKAKAEKYKDHLAATMITYPSTHGVFEDDILEITETIHKYGGRVYIDGANMNAMLGHTSPQKIGGDVCHLNLHKTFTIPHGGGGPGMGPICCTAELEPHLPGHAIHPIDGRATHAVSSTPYGSASILPIPHAYITLCGKEGLHDSSAIAILNANYMASQLEKEYKILYRNKNHKNAHEFIVDLREFKKSSGIVEEDIAKRLMDYGFHAPTISFPVPGGIMIEPTESESKIEMDRF
jgi:glycine dehydrogenase